MSKTIKDLEKLIKSTSPAQVALWLGYADGAAIQRWIKRGKIPKFRVNLVEQLLKEKGAKKDVRIIRRANGKKETTS